MIQHIKTSIKGLHCESCKTLIETEIDMLEGVSKVEINLDTNEAEIEFDDEKISKYKIFQDIEKLNYQVTEFKSENNETAPVSSRMLKISGLVLLGIILFAGGYALISQYGGFELLAKLNEGNIGYGLILVIGLLSGFHCVGMCGGLVIAYSAHGLKKDGPRSLFPHIQYNIGRLISYTIIGGILGGIGVFFGINPTFTGVIILIAGVFMLLMGISFMANIRLLEKIKIRTPKAIAKYLYNQKHSKKPKGPFIVGLLNGFMPCGPLQAMQLYALASGSVLRGSISMAIYAIGTIPLMFGFGAFLSAISKQHIKKIIMVSGILVAVLGLFMINRGLTNFGYGFTNISFTGNTSETEFVVSGDITEYQTARMELSYLGYTPNVLYVKKGVPVKWIIDVKQMSGCTDAIMIEELGIKKDLQLGENIIEFIPEQVGEIKFSCWMKMVWGKFIVTDEEGGVSTSSLEVVDMPQSTCGTGGSCGGGCSASTSSSGSCGCSSIRKK